MGYREFEKHFGRRAAARALREEVDAAWSDRGPTARSVLPDDNIIAAEYERWLPRSYFNSASDIDGFVRNDMLERATAALRALAA